MFDLSGRLLSHDEAHLTVAGVQMLAERIGPFLKTRLASIAQEDQGAHRACTGVFLAFACQTPSAF